MSPGSTSRGWNLLPTRYFLKAGRGPGTRSSRERADGAQRRQRSSGSIDALQRLSQSAWRARAVEVRAGRAWLAGPARWPSAGSLPMRRCSRRGGLRRHALGRLFIEAAGPRRWPRWPLSRAPATVRVSGPRPDATRCRPRLTSREALATSPFTWMRFLPISSAGQQRVLKKRAAQKPFVDAQDDP